MRTDIHQVLEMNKAGKITDEQAATLLEELLRGENAQNPPPAASSASSNPPPEAKARSRSRSHFTAHPGTFSDSVNSLVNSVVEHVFDASDHFNRHHQTDVQENRFQHSEWTAPTGTQPIFHGNQIRMSKLRELRLDRSEMSGNQIDASRLQEVYIIDGKFTGGRLRASSLRELNINRSEIVGLDLSTSKCAEIALTQESSLKDLHIRSSVLKEVKITEQTVWENSFLDGVVLAELRLVRSRLTECELQTARLLESNLTDCDWKDVLIRGLTFSEVQFVDSRFDRVLFTSDEKWGWKKKTFSKVRFENCVLNNVLFSDCRLSECTIRNVTLSDYKIRGLDLVGRVIDGDEAFRAAVGVSGQ